MRDKNFLTVIVLAALIIMIYEVRIIIRDVSQEETKRVIMSMTAACPEKRNYLTNTVRKINKVKKAKKRKKRRRK